MKALIDADVLRYEIGACGEFTDDNGERVVRSWEFVCGLLDRKIEEICELSWSDEPPILFLTVCPTTKKIMRDGGEFKPNFREGVAKTKPYKEVGSRAKPKPFHYRNITAYLINNYECVLAEGLEADDMLAIYQTNALNSEPTPTTTICSRDKDLRMVAGMHYGWECGKQAGIGPFFATPEGELTLSRKGKSGTPVVKGFGFKFFCAQLIMGDAIDNIPGLPLYGPKKAFDILNDRDTPEDMLKAVRDAYRAVYEDDWATHMREQGQLLWMVTEMDENNCPVMWDVPGWLYDETLEQDEA